jgi:uncharacterized protein
MSAQTSRASVDEFVNQKTLAVVGVSGNSKKFGNWAYRELKAKGYRIFPINRNLDSIDGSECYPNLHALPEKVDGVLIVVPPKETEQVVREADALSIKRIWMQQGSESDEAIEYCHKNGISEVHGECILMFAEPVCSYHRLHRGIIGILGKLPQ